MEGRASTEGRVDLGTWATRTRTKKKPDRGESDRAKARPLPEGYDMTDIPDLGPDFIVIPVIDLPAVIEDDEGFMKVAGLDHMDFVGGPISIKKPGRSHDLNVNQVPRNEYARAVAHLSFMRHLEADPEEATRVLTLAKSISGCGENGWYSLKEKRRGKLLRQARLADRMARESAAAQVSA